MSVTPFRVPTFHIRTVVSSLAEARRVLSGDQASALTFFVWVRGVTQSCVPAGGISVCTGCDTPAGDVCTGAGSGGLVRVSLGADGTVGADMSVPQLLQNLASP